MLKPGMVVHLRMHHWMLRHRGSAVISLISSLIIVIVIVASSAFAGKVLGTFVLVRDAILCNQLIRDVRS